MTKVSIQSGQKVSITCVVELDEQEHYATFDEKNPLEVIAGVSDESPIRLAISSAIVGMNPNESKSIKIMCADAFGNYDPEMQGEIELSEFNTELNIGDPIEIQFEDEAEAHAATISEISETHVTYDLNHPLAGHDIMLQFMVLKVLS